MNHIKNNLIVVILLLFTFTVSTFSLTSCNNSEPQQKNKNSVSQQNDSMVKSSDPWTAKDLIQPDELVKELSNKKPEKPLIIQIGFSFLYEQNHIPGAEYLGPASNQVGLRSLKNGVKNLDKNKNIVLYCGCCPWTDCPNIHPAFETMKSLGFKNVKLLYIPQTFVKDWVDKGYPTEKK